MNLKSLILLTTVCLAGSLSAQDEHFSQFYALPMHMNPALTGAYEGTYRLSMVYRSQWGNAFDTPYKTVAAGGDTRLNMRIRKAKTKDHIGIGLFFINDEIAEFQASTNKLSGYAAYHKHLGEKRRSFLSAGIKLGIIQRNITYGNLVFEDQFNQVNEYSLPTGERLPPNNFGRMDLSTGINYSVELDKSSIYLGVGYHHFTEPDFSFFNELDPPPIGLDVSQKLDSKLVAHFSLYKKLNYEMALQRRIVYQKQGIHNQLDLGSNLEFTFKSRNTAVLFGLWLTAVDDLDGLHMENITPLIGVRQRQFVLGLSYDVHLRDTFQSPFGYNSFELTLRFSGEHENTGAYCPTF